ncbi:MAG: hypothetical protein RBT75_12110 [Anaerolineae bacterium]|jgi:hypothetical protein|nr:hypothetical protein [Anaerolineae bacterium]
MTKQLVSLIVITVVIGLILIALALGGDPEYWWLAVAWLLLMGIYGIYPAVADEQAKRG